MKVRILLAAAAAAILSIASPVIGQVGGAVIASAQTATGAGARFQPNAGLKTFQATGTTTAGAGAATVKIQGSNVLNPSVDGDWVDMGTITLTLATTKSGDGFASDAPWRWVRSNVTAISGTGGSVDVMVGY